MAQLGMAHEQRRLQRQRQRQHGIQEEEEEEGKGDSKSSLVVVVVDGGYSESDAETTRIAALLIDDAVTGFFDPLHATRGKISMRAQRCYHNTALLRYATLAVYLLLAPFEQPTWCLLADDVCDARARALDSGIYKLPVRVHLSIELACLVLLAVFDVSLRAVDFGLWQLLRRARCCLCCKRQRGLEWQPEHYWLLARAIAMFIATIDVCLSLARVDGSIRLAALLRPLIFVASNVSMRRTLRVVVWSVRAVVDVVFLIVALILYFAWIGVLLFQTNAQRPFFGSYGRAVSELHVSITTANFPDVMVQAYAQHRVFFLFFLSFFLAGL
jgi:hypothetical protein